jgi:hypothetical protein
MFLRISLSTILLRIISSTKCADPVDSAGNRQKANLVCKARRLGRTLKLMQFQRCFHFPPALLYIQAQSGQAAVSTLATDAYGHAYSLGADQRQEHVLFCVYFTSKQPLHAAEQSGDPDRDASDSKRTYEIRSVTPVALITEYVGLAPRQNRLPFLLT